MAKKIKKRQKAGFICSFCAKRNDDVKILVVGKGNARICDECIVSAIQVCVGREVDVVSPAMEQMQEAYAAVESLMAAAEVEGEEGGSGLNVEQIPVRIRG